jgi:Trm5-related predicted tRNA methylase
MAAKKLKLKKLKLWKFEREDYINFDEYDAVVVLAPDADTAKRIVREEEVPHGDGFLYGGQFVGTEPTEVDLTVPGVVLDSFNAG